MWKKRLLLTLKVFVSGALIWFLVNQVDLAAARERVLKVPPEALLLVAFIFMVQLVIANMRWRVVLDALLAAKLAFLQTFRIVYIGLFFNQALPSSVGGDAVRMVLARRAGMPLLQSISSVFLERVANVLALVIIVFAAAPLFIDHVPVRYDLWVWGGLVALLAAAIVGLVFLFALAKLPESFHRWRLVRGMVGLSGDTRRVFLMPRNTLRALAWSVAGFVNITLIVYVLALGLKLDVTLADCLVLVPPVLLISTLPVSIAGWGVREGAMVAAFGLIGVPDEGALVLSILLGLLSLVFCLPGGLVWMLSSEKSSDIDEALPSFTVDSAAPREKTC